MKPFEEMVRGEVTGGRVVDYWVTPIYQDAGMPSAIQMKMDSYNKDGGTLVKSMTICIPNTDSARPQQGACRP